MKLAHPRWILLTVLALCAAGAGSAHAQTRAQSAADPAERAARGVLAQAKRIHRDGKQNAMLRGLRELRAPSLMPMFQRLAKAEQPGLRLHGLMGVAELSPDHRLTLEQVASVKSPQAVAQLVGAALDDELLAPADAARMMGWQDLDPGIKTLIAARLVAQGAGVDPAGLRAGLHEALSGDNPARRGLAALLLMQLGEDGMQPRLNSLNRSDEPSMDPLRATLLQTALTRKLDRAAGWAYTIAREDAIDPGLSQLALRTALRFGQPDAPALWQKRYTTATDPADRIRLALLALRVAPWAPASLFDPLTRSGNRFIAQVGRAGQAIARDPVKPDPIVGLIQINHPLGNRWALAYARDQAPDPVARLIALALVVGYHGDEDRTRPARVDTTAAATQLLCKRFAGSAPGLLRPLLVDDGTDPWLRRAVLLGLVRMPGSGASSPRPGDLDPRPYLQGIEGFDDPTASHLLTLLRAKHGMALSRPQQHELSLLVMGGGELNGGLRAQAAWAYLRQHNKL